MAESTQARYVREYYEKTLGHLKGLTIVNVGALEDEDGIWPVIYIRNINSRNPKTQALVAMRDPEGNGPGAFELAELQ